MYIYNINKLQFYRHVWHSFVVSIFQDGLTINKELFLNNRYKYNM